MKTNEKILTYLKGRPSYTGSLTGITEHVNLPEIVVKSHMSALVSADMCRRLQDGDTPCFHLTMPGLEAADSIHLQLAL